MVVREGPKPAIAFLGTFDDAERARVTGLFEQLSHMLESWCYVDYARAEEACIELAQRLVDRVAGDVLDEAQYVAIPRGGHIVLGMFATVAGLRPDHVGTMDDDPDRPVVVIDDAALTGNRFGRWLAATGKRRVVFAPLCAPAELTRAVEEAEDRVIACLTAVELKDVRATTTGGDDDLWRATWRARLDDQRYWVGRPEHLVFAWKEPDRSLWNPVTDRLEPGWRTAPPEICLSNRLLVRSSPNRIQRQPYAPGPLAPGDELIVGEDGGEIVVGDPEQGSAIGLVGTAATMWRSIVDCGTIEGAVQDLTATFDVDPTRLSEDVRGFADMLMKRGLLVWR